MDKKLGALFAAIGVVPGVTTAQIVDEYRIPEVNIDQSKAGPLFQSFVDDGAIYVGVDSLWINSDRVNDDSYERLMRFNEVTLDEHSGDFYLSEKMLQILVGSGVANEEMERTVEGLLLKRRTLENLTPDLREQLSQIVRATFA